MSSSGNHAQIVTDLAKTVDAMVTQANTVAAAFGNPANQQWFAGITPTPAQLTGGAQGLAAAQALAKTRVAGSVEARNLKQDALEILLNQGAMSVEALCRANPGQAAAIAAASGYREKDLHPHVKLPLELKNAATSGSILAMAKAGPKSKKVWYDWRYSTNGGQAWTQVQGTNDAKTVISGLTALTTVMVQVRLTIKNVPGNWSDPVSILVK